MGGCSRGRLCPVCLEVVRRSSSLLTRSDLDCQGTRSDRQELHELFSDTSVASLQALADPIMSIVQQCNADAHADKLNLALGAYRTEVSSGMTACRVVLLEGHRRELGDRTYACRFEQNSHTTLQSHPPAPRSPTDTSVLHAFLHATPPSVKLKINTLSGALACTSYALLCLHAKPIQCMHSCILQITSKALSVISVNETRMCMYQLV